MEASSLGSWKPPPDHAVRKSTRMVVAASEVAPTSQEEPDSTSCCEGSSSSVAAVKAAEAHSKARAAAVAEARRSPEFHQSGENVGKSTSKDASFNETTTTQLASIASTMTVNDTNEGKYIKCAVSFFKIITHTIYQVYQPNI